MGITITMVMENFWIKMIGLITSVRSLMWGIVFVEVIFI